MRLDGDAHAPVVWIAHGFAQNGGLFDTLAFALAAAGYRVIRPDMVGCGRSCWAPDPFAHYCLQHFARICDALWNNLDLHGPVRWIGTSMGGALGWRLAATDWQARMTHLVLNDVVPAVPAGFPNALAQATHYAKPSANLPAFADTLRRRPPTGNFLSKSTPEQLELASRLSRPGIDGSVWWQFDPAMCLQLQRHPQDADLWHLAASVRSRVLLMRAARSPFASQADAARMDQLLGQRCEVAMLNAPSHPLALESPEELALIERFLRRS